MKRLKVRNEERSEHRQFHARGGQECGMCVLSAEK